MIVNFSSKLSADIYNGINSRYTREFPRELHYRVQRLLDQLNAVTRIETLRIPPGNHLEKLKGDLESFWSVRINKQWRIIFQWLDGNVHNVNIVDYH